MSSISVPPVKIMRYDEAFFSIDTNNIPASLDKLRKQFGPFSDGFVNNVVCSDAHDSISCDMAIRDFILSYDMRSAWKDSKNILGDQSALEAQITDAYRHFRYHFPKRDLPKAVYIDFTGFNYNILNIEGVYGIGLEFYLGKDNVIYDGLSDHFPGYIRRNCTKEYAVANFVRGWMMNEFPYDPPKNDLINKMVWEGKMMYLMKALLRNTPDSIITGYTAKQLSWCADNEAKMWATLIENKKVYSDNDEDLQHFTENGPFTPDFPRDSPGEAGNWLGLRIVEAYMARNPNVSLQQLMDQKDGSFILTRAKYKPKF
ncbi:MAG TPA: hypothetical protein VFU15_00165 [Bacteroidia bacterium]|nr:hypothetical protein [Bacteroidia bacterium]